MAVVGHVAVPGDKSISHRAVLIGAIAEGETRVTGFGRSGDTLATVDGMRELGVEIEWLGEDELVVHGVGLRGLHAGVVDCANSGTLMRLLAGIAAGQEGEFTLTGDESLSTRPMERIAEPLRRMGSDIATTDGHGPLTVRGGKLRGAELEPEVASAQVKSAILLAGLNASGATTVIERIPTRDHTELMLEAAGAKIRRSASSVTVEPGSALRLGEIRSRATSPRPRRSSSQRPSSRAATSRSTISASTRAAPACSTCSSGWARASLSSTAIVSAASRSLPSRCSRASSSRPRSPPTKCRRMIDELPLVALLASHARGETVVSGARELRVKETDRIEAVTDGLQAFGARIHSRDDGWTITGVPTRLKGGRMDARGDHRIAMLAAVAGLASREGVEIEGADTAAISFPGFYDLLDGITR